MGVRVQRSISEPPLSSAEQCQASFFGWPAETYVALHSHLLFCFIPHNLCNKHQGCPGTRTTREATLPSLACLPCSSIPSESLHPVPLFLSLKMTPRPCRGRTPLALIWGHSLGFVLTLATTAGAAGAGSTATHRGHHCCVPWALLHTPWASQGLCHVSGNTLAQTLHITPG